MRPAGRAAMPAHARDIASLLASLGFPRSPAEIRHAMQIAGSSWHVVEAEDATLLGVQWIEPSRQAAAASIATFTADAPGRLAAGSALFGATRDAALKLGYRWLIADIASGNEGACIYYRSRGFEMLAGPHRPGRIILRHDLR